MAVRKAPEPLEALLFNLDTLDEQMNDHTQLCGLCQNNAGCEKWTGLVCSHNFYFLALVEYEKEINGKKVTTDI